LRVSDASPPEPTGPTVEDVAVARRVRRALADDDDTVPRLPRGRGGITKLSSAHVIKILLTASLLVMLIVVQKPCADSVSQFVTGFDDKGSAAAQMPKPGTVDRGSAGSAVEHYELIGPHATEAEVRAAFERERARAKAAAGSGSNAGSAGSNANAGSGSAGSNANAGSGSATAPR
jgi:hypothetical protein